MGYRSLGACVSDLERTGQLAVIDDEIDPHLEAAAIQRRVYQAGGPALYFRRVKRTAFPLVSNLFGTIERARFLFRDTLDAVRRLVELKVDPGAAAKRPWRYRGVPRTLWHLRPRQVRRGPILENQTTIDRLPAVQSWPMDGGPFVTLPLVHPEDPDRPGLARLTGPIIPTVISGVLAVHAVDAAGVHPLLLAIASERYVPYSTVRRPQEILTIASAILGQGQLSLAKYLLIVAGEDDPALDIHDIAAFLRHLLERIDWTSDLHFQTRTTIDTLDYSGHGLNQGSKVVMAAAGPRRREMPVELPLGLRLPDGFADPRLVLPGILAIRGPKFVPGSDELIRFCRSFGPDDPIRSFPLIVIVDDSEFTARSEGNFLWVTFTRSNPAADIEGIDSFIDQKHWGCRGPLVIDGRIKPHHAPPLIDAPEIERRVDALAAPGGPLHGIY